MQEITLKTDRKTQLVDITQDVQAALDGANGARAALVYVPHTTAGVTINEGADPAVVSDLLAHLDKLVPWGAAYRHAEGNSAAHIKASLVGSSCTALVEDGQLVLGTWQAIFLCEFDGPRERDVLVKVVQG